MADHTINIDVHDISVPELNPINIAIINLPNPVTGYSANAKEVRDLIQIPKYTIYESGTSNVINGTNYFDYFPEEGGGGGGGGGMTPEEVQAMIAASIDTAISESSNNAIANSTITNFVNSSIETATATFRGTYNTQEDLDAAAGDKNDYAFLVTTDTAGNTIYNRYKYVTVDTGDLPDGYTQLLYIDNQTNGAAYIDTGIVPSYNTGFYIKMVPGNSYSTWATYFGAYGNSSRGYLDTYQYYDFNNRGPMFKDSSSTVNTDIEYGAISEISFKYPKVTVNEEAPINIENVNEFTLTEGLSVHIFGYNNSGSHNQSSKPNMKLYEFKLFTADDTVLRNFIPCRNPQNEIGLYDTVSQTFFGNMGSGTFKAGPAASGYWEFEYALNNSSFTAEQWAAINSGLKASDKSQIATNTNDISLADITNNFTAAEGFTKNTTLSKIYKQGKHVFGKLVLEINSGTMPTVSASLATTSEKPSIPIVMVGYCGVDTFKIGNTAYVYIDASNGEISGYDNEINNADTAINIDIDYVVS